LKELFRFVIAAARPEIADVEISFHRHHADLGLGDGKGHGAVAGASGRDLLRLRQKRMRFVAFLDADVLPARAQEVEGGLTPSERLRLVGPVRDREVEGDEHLRRLLGAVRTGQRRALPDAA
jgi:hypothetical protein